MKDKIKEILENVKNCCDITKEQSFTVYQRQDILKLLDYITNLQESEAYYYGQYKDYKSRNEKAIEYIKEAIVNDDYLEDDISTDIEKASYNKYVNSSKLLNILGGDDNEKGSE